MNFIPITKIEAALSVTLMDQCSAEAERVVWEEVSRSIALIRLEEMTGAEIKDRFFDVVLPMVIEI